MNRDREELRNAYLADRRGSPWTNEQLAKRHGVDSQKTLDEIRKADGLSPQLRDIFAEQREAHLQRRNDRIVRTVVWCFIFAAIIAFYAWVWNTAPVEQLRTYIWSLL